MRFCVLTVLCAVAACVQGAPFEPEDLCYEVTVWTTLAEVTPHHWEVVVDSVTYDACSQEDGAP